MVIKMEIQKHSPLNSDFLSSNHLSLADSKAWLPHLLSLSPSRTLTSDTVISGTNGGTFNEDDLLMVPGRVVASAPIPQGSLTTQIEPWTLIGKVNMQQLSVECTSFGTLDLDKKSRTFWNKDTHWVRSVRLSDDCHSYNVQLKLQPSFRFYPNNKGVVPPKLVLQTVRPIEAGQELQLWFSEDILAMLQVVFLNPSNIQGDKKYTCTRCPAQYESPNPLKLHITLACGKLPVVALWERLVSLMRNSELVSDVEIKVDDFKFKLSPEPQNYRQRNALDLTLGTVIDVTPNSSYVNKGFYRETECSAFKPFRKRPIEINNTPTAVSPSLMSDLPVVWPITLETDVVQLHRNLMQNQVLASGQSTCSNDAQLESLVSSLGKAKQGHICLYCGKCYSRKYGLKIHIRTHTGYKPLKCKFCDRPFGDPSNLNKHVRLHAEGNTPYKCELCGKILVRRRDLERHLKSRHLTEMHPNQNVIPSSPLATNDNSNSALETFETDTQLHEINSSVSSTENVISCDVEDDDDVRIIDIRRNDELELESSGDVDIKMF